MARPKIQKNLIEQIEKTIKTQLDVLNASVDAEEIEEDVETAFSDIETADKITATFSASYPCPRCGHKKSKLISYCDEYAIRRCLYSICGKLFPVTFKKSDE